MKNIAILISTYNGERYLLEQVYSILAQDAFRDNNFNIKVYIRDDGSSDSTLMLIDVLKNQEPNIIFSLTSDSNLGPADSFLHMLSVIESDYYFFCDQDDIWLKDKVSRAMSFMGERSELPIAYFSDLKLCDKDGEVISNSLWNEWGYRQKFFDSWKNYFSVSLVTGCTLAINRAAREKCMSHERYHLMLHDQWISYICAKFGIVIADKNPSILYRQHDNNVMGGGDLSLRDYINKSEKFVKYFDDAKKMCREEGDISVSELIRIKVFLSLQRLILSKLK
ncbi:glycosyltransferase family 2 protein [Vibrio parahaemolyticus]|uniref:Abequosyltransferase RfbV n=1 Tax=Vibrio parahaemolyticus TaxID=670 RepID=A0A7M1WD86_VIBPH|nr:glycosyltransferase family 2 protein [Vibrio parahaemolyticus]EJG0872012.1 glycosyltransferase family 2 protein [Vibrio parahaemolyticus O3]EJG0900671.1 glycosyltransferase family 2 protein [Vibrio parahaemolyticus O3:K56]EJG1074955.1 glycosyltransferase family 2 protein [Vibrio parahaemolyticus O1:K56]EGR1973264.1 glycosyltransferase family 2 protein [Vibrio parahaemolyticus]EGR5852642.1 glycosyltransferase family 2 protein [Vibrio parahaemolyticus]